MKAICIDIGNSRSKMALVENYQILEKKYFLENEFEPIVNSWLKNQNIDYAVVSNVTSFEINRYQVMKKLKNVFF